MGSFADRFKKLQLSDQAGEPGKDVVTKLKSSPVVVSPSPGKEVVKPGKKAGRKPKGEVAMSDAERARLYRERKKSMQAG